ncbi:MAG: glutaredoxin family protein [Alcanivorax sp.]|nr:glutaredoxin family protein [Alcanivorax sp.]
MQVVLYTTLGCHLCEQAREWVRTVDPSVTINEVDVADDDVLLNRYGDMIPVLSVGGEALSWPFGLLDIQRLLQNA